VSLVLYTARLSYDGDDRLDVSRYGNHEVGAVFAPSLELLYAFRVLHRAGRATREAFGRYAERYHDEMRTSYVTHRAIWDEVLARPEVTACCYCENPSSCHRLLLAGFFTKLGARYEGER
jgi:uncharacterized protein YeaO (DUF488 family)